MQTQWKVIFVLTLLCVVATLLDTARPILESCRETSAAFANVVPENQFWRWKEMWQNSLRNAVFSATLIEYLSSGALLSLPGVADVLGSMFLSMMLCIA